MPKEFIVKGRTVSGSTEKINLQGGRPGYGYQLHDFKLWGSTNLGATSMEGWGTIAVLLQLLLRLIQILTMMLWLQLLYL